MAQLNNEQNLMAHAAYELRRLQGALTIAQAKADTIDFMRLLLNATPPSQLQSIDLAAMLDKTVQEQVEAATAAAANPAPLAEPDEDADAIAAAIVSQNIVDPVLPPDGPVDAAVHEPAEPTAEAPAPEVYRNVDQLAASEITDEMLVKAAISFSGEHPREYLPLLAKYGASGCLAVSLSRRAEFYAELIGQRSLPLPTHLSVTDSDLA